MPQSKLFQTCTWGRTVPAPFDDAGVTSSRTDVSSKHNNAASPKATLHASTLRGILAYMDIDSSVETPAAGTKSAIGTQTEEIIVAEYPSRSGSIQVVNFNKNSGKFSVDCFSDPSATPGIYSLKDTGESGAALRYVAERLRQRPEEMKILILISDGQPASDGYYGTEAEADLRGIKKEYTNKGVTLFAAAIGNDKPNIQRIYKEGFLDVTDLSKLPTNLVRLIVNYARL